MLMLMLVILMLILMLLDLNTGYVDTDADFCIRIISSCSNEEMIACNADANTRHPDADPDVT